MTIEPPHLPPIPASPSPSLSLPSTEGSLERDPTVELAQRWLARQAAPSPDENRLRAALERRHLERRRVQRATATLATIVALTWLIDALLQPAPGLRCAWVGAYDGLRYGAVHIIGFVLAAGLINFARPWAQMLARAFWWSALTAATAGLWVELGTLPLTLPIVAAAATTSLMLVGRRGLEASVLDEGFPLAAHRERVVLMMIFAMADVVSLLGGALNHDEAAVAPLAALDLGAALALSLAMVGLYRLRLWGLVCTLLLHLSLAALALSGALFYEPAFAAVIVVMAAAQVVTAGPLVVRLVRGRSPSRPPWSLRPRAREAIALGLILSLTALAAVGFARGLDPARVAASCAED